jgi:hypothetical protein
MKKAEHEPGLSDSDGPKRQYIRGRRALIT